jgi:hypothetical protein
MTSPCFNVAARYQHLNVFGIIAGELSLQLRRREAHIAAPNSRCGPSSARDTLAVKPGFDRRKRMLLRQVSRLIETPPM